MSLIKYLQETHAELKFVKWPTQRQTIVYTALVIIISILTAAYLGLFDYLFSNVIRFITESQATGSAGANIINIATSSAQHATTSIIDLATSTTTN
jgi:preprotein translocase SecE subunit